jgi:hypothetical protein
LIKKTAKKVWLFNVALTTFAGASEERHKAIENLEYVFRKK